MKLTGWLLLLQRYRISFSHWLWLGAVIWALLLFLINWLFHVYPAFSAADKFYVITAAILVMLLYQLATVRYFNNVLLRLRHFLSSTLTNKAEYDSTSLIERGEVGALFNEVSRTAQTLQRHFDNANNIAQQQQLLSEAVKQSSNSVIITDLQANILFVNQAFCNISGYSADEVIGKTPKLLQSGLTPAKTYVDIRKALEQGHSWCGELINKCKNGDLISEKISIVPIKNASGEVWRLMAVKENVTALKQAEQHIQQLAFLDNVTKLANRHSLLLQFQKWQLREFALLMININDFKQINSQYGLIAGDELLANFAYKLRELLPKSSFVARLNSDEFIVMLPDTNIHGLTQLIQKKLQQLNGAINTGLFNTVIRCRFAACFYPVHGSNMSDLLSNADMAMRNVKHRKEDFCIFQPVMKLEHEKQLKQLTILRQELLQPVHLKIVVQPQFDMSTHDCIGAEVLLRLPHPDTPNVNIYSYILLVERYGLAKQLDQWVIKQSLMLLQTLQQHRYAGKLSVNISAASFQDPYFVDSIKAQLANYPLTELNLTLEITETALISQPHVAIQNAEKLQQLGICLAIDDFGTGHSSLAYLQQFSVCLLKIDKSFIDNVTTNAKDRAIVETTLALAKGLGLKTVAEGIENQQQCKLLQQLGCDSAQGFFFSKPISTEQFTEMATDGRSAQGNHRNSSPF
ncbi:putative bifunctional diguanylate cyclase/phosphodiesterase [Rheinheimera sp.]|uniref:putative bifunctional diguanylate cyclase/phosphodiesterase n=1 Tax=Rheinheimera sp. TaxID=1869214 RepID=UPI004048DFF1